jgi:hypothetical protein
MGRGGRKEWAVSHKRSGVWYIRVIEAIKTLASIIKRENIKKHTKGPNDGMYRRLGPFRVRPVVLVEDDGGRRSSRRLSVINR